LGSSVLCLRLNMFDSRRRSSDSGIWGSNWDRTTRTGSSSACMC
jgi:hypothetical protein